MLLLLESFGPYATANLPAAAKWNSAHGVTIVAGGGRSGTPNDNCAAFSTSLGSVLSRTVAPGAEAGVYTATLGFALRVLSLSATAMLGAIQTAISKFNLLVLETGALQVRQVSNDVDLGVVCQTAPGIVPRATGGCYVEMKIRFVLGVQTAVQVRVGDQWGAMNPAAQGALLALTTEELPYTTVRLGGGTGEEPATWRVADVYLTDGVPVAVIMSPDGRLVDNSGYLGNVKVDAVYATADGVNLTVGNTPWTPNTGASHYDRINEHPPDDDASYEASTPEAAPQLDVYIYTMERLTLQPGGTRQGCLGQPWPLYGLAWDGFLRVTGDPTPVSPVVRRIVTGVLATDQVLIDTAFIVSSSTYAYFVRIWDRNPITQEAFTLSTFQAKSPLTPGALEFGINRAGDGPPSASIPVGSFFIYGND